MKYFVLLLFLSLQTFALEPSRKAGVSNDVFISYQWALQNEGQRLLRDTDDIHPILTESRSGFDIQWKELQDLLRNKKRRETVIAIVDSGVSSSHEDIKDNVLKGFNFTAPNEKLQNDTNDDLGHGTHIAGIIAAHIHNANGIAGVAENIKILPLKVYSAKKETGINSFIERVTKAINYAVESKVDVINLSMGWPLMIDQENIQKAIQRALDQNITVVAGAGNDGHSLRVLPCSYDGVICVGASGLGGDVPNFSNYGGQVDIMAPGEAILSLWPPLLMSKNFGLRKYNISSGTSQAAPFVSAAAAILKSIYPNISNDEITARLFTSARSDLSWDQKFALNGLLQIASAVKAKPQVVVRPVLKKLDQIYVHPVSGEFSFQLPIRNYWTQASAVQIQIDSTNTNIEWSKKSFSLGLMSEQETRLIKIQGRLRDLSINNKLNFTVEIQSAGQQSKFTHESTLALKTDQLKNLKVYHHLPEMKSVVDYTSRNKNAEFYSQKTSDLGIELTIYRFSENQLLARGTYFIPQAVNLYPHIGFSRVDMNCDGIEDYFVTAIIKKGKDIEIKHFVLDQNMKLLNARDSVWNFVDEGILIHQPSLKFVEWDSRYFGKTALPVFWSKGAIPEADLNPDPFDRITEVRRGLYYYMPYLENGVVKLKTRLLTNEQNLAQIRKKIGARFDQEITLLNFKVKNNRIIEVIFSLGISADLRYYTAEFDLNKDDIIVTNLKLPAMDLRFHIAKNMTENKVAFFGIYKNELARLLILDTQTREVQDYELSSNSAENGIVSMLAVNEDDSFVNVFVEGVESFLFYKISKKNGSVSKSVDPIHRFSYLPGQFFTDVLHPMEVNQNISIYVDSSWINSRNVHTSTAGSNGIQTPVRWSLELAERCVSLNPKKVLSSDRNLSYLFLCQQNNEYVLKTYQL